MSKLIEATVVSAKMDKTIVVRVDRKFRHPRFQKVLKRQKKFKVHCEDKSIKPGDFIVIQETKPLSKDKHFMFVKKLKSGAIQTVELKEEPEVKKKKVAPAKKESEVKKEEVKAVVKPPVKKRAAKKTVAVKAK